MADQESPNKANLEIEKILAKEEGIQIIKTEREKRLEHQIAQVIVLLQATGKALEPVVFFKPMAMGCYSLALQLLREIKRHD